METNQIEFGNADVLICKDIQPLKGNDVAPPLKLDEEYQVLNIFKCGCGKSHIDVGLKSEYNFVRCYDCEENLPPEIHWCHPSRFIKN